VAIPSLSLAGKVALITGGRRGIGEACALVFAEAGADVAVCDWVVDTGELAAVAGKIQSMGRRSLALKTDVTSKFQVTDLVQKVADELGPIDILINNAGTGTGKSPEPGDYEKEITTSPEWSAMKANAPSILFMNEEIWDRVLNTNLKSCMLCSQAVAKIMVERETGIIINIASVEAFGRGPRKMAAYPISKRGMIMFTEGLAASLAPYNIRVNAIAPGGIETELMRYIFAYPERLKGITENMPLSKTLLSPETCAHTALYLASDLSTYVTGQTIVVDAGLTL